jgi:hypothetical protein
MILAIALAVTLKDLAWLAGGGPVQRPLACSPRSVRQVLVAFAISRP